MEEEIKKLHKELGGLICPILNLQRPYYYIINSDLLSNRRLRNSYFSVTLKNVSVALFS
jgi:hypothetical protein